jgi:hypothetical protein
VPEARGGRAGPRRLEANYTAGLHVFDACDPQAPVLVGHFDTFPSSDTSDFSGAWSNYPFFASGTVIVSDRSNGLFVLDVSPALAALACDCDADLDGDGTVDVTDLLALLGAWGGPDGDVDGDGTTDVTDLLALLGAWGPCV